MSGRTTLRAVLGEQSIQLGHLISSYPAKEKNGKLFTS